MEFIIARMAAGKPRYGELSIAGAKLRAQTWKEANGDLPKDLWTEAYFAVMRAPNIKRFPDTGEFRAFVERTFNERWKNLKRAREMLGAATSDKPKPPPPPPKYNPTREVVLRNCIRATLRGGSYERAQAYENELAQLEGRKPEDLLSRQIMPSPDTRQVDDVPVVIPTSPTMQAALLRARERFWRSQGRSALADDLRGEADALVPEQRTDVPEAGP